MGRGACYEAHRPFFSALFTEVPKAVVNEVGPPLRVCFQSKAPEASEHPRRTRQRVGKEYRSNIIAQRYSGSLLGRDMRTSMTPNVLARAPKIYSYPTIYRLLPRRNRALLLHQQTTASIGARMCAAAILPSGLTQTNLGHAAFYRIRRPVSGGAPSHRRSEPDVT